MAAKRIGMSIIKQIIRLRQPGAKLQTIAKAVGPSRNTIKKYLRLIEAKGFNYEDLLKKDDNELELLLSNPGVKSGHRFEDLQKLFPYFKKELKRTGATRWALWGEYKLQHPDGYSCSHFCGHLKQWLDSAQAVMHIGHEAGDKMYVGFAGKKLQFIDPETGEIKDVEVFVPVLGKSQPTYVEAVPDQKKENFIRATENALHYYGGIPRVIVPDNLKSAVNRACKYEAELNENFLDFANHYGTSVLPARSYKPRDKALVENTVKIIYNRVYAPLRNEVFHSIGQLNCAIKQLLGQHNQKPFQQERKSRKGKFELEEKEALKPLPVERYELKRYKLVTVLKNCHVQLSEDKHYYSAPYRYIGKKVKLSCSQNWISVFHKQERIAFHVRDYKRFGYTTLKGHLPSTHQFVSGWSPVKFTRWAASISPVVEKYIIKILEQKQYPEQAYRGCVGILAQGKKVGYQRLIRAVERAGHFNIYNYKTIKKILDGKLDMLTEDQTPAQLKLPIHDNIRGGEQYK